MIKQTVVSGTFYPDNAVELKAMLDLFFSKVSDAPITSKPYGVIVPHAGYVYSGQVAANIYYLIKKYDYKTAVIIAPSHHTNHITYFVGDYDGYETPFGTLKTNKEVVQKLLKNQEFKFDPIVDLREHALEVQLPFLHYLNPEIKIVPIIFCRQNIQNAQKLSGFLSGIMDTDSLVVISTDLSHFHHAKKAEEIDQKLIDYTLNMNIDGLNNALIYRECEACGFGGILTLLYMMQSKPNAKIDHVCYTHSGKISGDNSRVVGYFGAVGYDEARETI